MIDHIRRNAFVYMFVIAIAGWVESAWTLRYVERELRELASHQRELIELTDSATVLAARIQEYVNYLKADPLAGLRRVTDGDGS